MQHPFKKSSYSDNEDITLIEESVKGNRNALDILIKKHQQFIFNIALKMVNNVADAEDITQEVLIKVITNLAKYDPKKAKFRTWAYRIVFNYILNLKQQPFEKKVEGGFDFFFDFMNKTPNQELTGYGEDEYQELVNETKVSCMAGMLMCLNREQRLLYIVGHIFEIDHNLASEMFEITPDNFRKKLSRTRKDLHSWMHNKCGLLNKENPCRCSKKTKSFIERGMVDPKNKKWHSDYKKKVFELSENKVDETLIEVDRVYAKLHQESPFKSSHKVENLTEELFHNEKFNKIFGLN